MATVHIIGAGMSGLAAATSLAERHVPVKLYEASSAAGGRARSSSDAALGVIDHGLHLFSGAAHELQRFIARIDARDQFIRVNLPRLPAMPLADALIFAGHALQPDGLRVEQMLSQNSPLQDRVLSPLCRLALTQPAHKASAKQLRALLMRQLKRGGRKFYMAKESLQASFIAPALHQLEYRGGSVYFGQALKSVEFSADGPSHLCFARKKLPLQEGDVLILATPPAVSKSILPDIEVPPATHCAITFHFKTAHHEAEGSVCVLSESVADLLRYDAGAIRAMIRLAEHTWNGDETLLAARVWKAIQQQHTYLRGHALPPWASWREKRAGHVPCEKKLPSPLLPPRTLLAGDWLDATCASSLEAAAASGHAAADAAYGLLDRTRPRTQSLPFVILA